MVRPWPFRHYCYIYFYHFSLAHYTIRYFIVTVCTEYAFYMFCVTFYVIVLFACAARYSILFDYHFLLQYPKFYIVI